MANELICVYPTGNTLYAHVFDATGQIWNGSAFEAPASGNWATYDIAMSEAATSTQIYRGTMPGAGAGAYSFVVRKQAGDSPAVADIAVAGGSLQWDGSAELPLSDVNTDVEAILADTGTDGVALASGAVDDILERGVGNVEDTADAHSLATLILAALESSLDGTLWTIKKTDGSTTFTTKTVGVDANADPVISVT